MSDLDRIAATRPAPRPRLEEFEPRVVPSVAPQGVVFTGGLTPAQVRHAYGFDRIGFGIIPGDGRGQTIALVTAYDDPTIALDLAVFDRQFGLPNPPSFAKVALPGTAAVDPNWALETALDVEWAHAVAPEANLLLVEAPSTNTADLIGAVNFARRWPGVSVVSMSWGEAEFSAESTLDDTFTTPANHAGVAFVAASGDGGAAGALWPALSPNVLAVGGTQLAVDAAGNYLAEWAWPGSAGGASRYEIAPAAQSAVTGSSRRTGPDVSYNAAPATGYAVYTSIPVNGLVAWMVAGGTSAGAPQWAGLLAIADQMRALVGKPALTDAVAAIYGLPAGYFHDVVAGSNGAVAARPGYDAITGRGSPYADRVVSGLVAAGTVKAPPAPTPTPTPAPDPPSTNKGRDLTFITRRLADFLRKTTGSTAKPAAVLTSRPAVRLPSGSAKFLGASTWEADL
jgi:subtilase family serine protease